MPNMPPASIPRLFNRPGRRFALFVVLGAAIVALPLAEVWRRQGLELRTAHDARRTLEAVTVAGQAQRALAAHRPYAAAVLAGRSEQEPERLRRQLAVDAEVGTLVAALEAQQQHRALDEADQLRAEWAGLLEGIGRRRIPIAVSDATHEMLHEQVFVIMDLAATVGGLQGQAGRSIGHEEWTLALRTLPRYAAALAALDVPEAAGPTRTARPALRAARRVHNEAGVLLAKLDATGANEPAPDPALVRALVALRQSASQLTESAAAIGPGSAGVNVAPRAQATARDAQAALVAHLDARLVESTVVMERERLLVALAGLLAAFMGALAAPLALPRKLSVSGTGSTTDPVEGRPHESGLDAPAAQGGESQGPASDLLERLRRRAVDAEAGDAWVPKPPKPF